MSSIGTFFQDSVFFGVLICLITYEVGMWVRKKTGSTLANPLIISVILIIAFLLLFQIGFEKFYNGARYISYLLTPATVCLAVPLYEKLSLLKKNYKAILLGIFSGALTSLLSILVMAIFFNLSHTHYVSILPKSITTAIGIGVADELGGISAITTASIMITGVFGNVIAEVVFKLFRITDPIAKGIGLGTAAHAIGTAKAMEIGETEGAMSSLSIAVAGVMTVVMASFFANIYL